MNLKFVLGVLTTGDDTRNFLTLEDMRPYMDIKIVNRHVDAKNTRYFDEKVEIRTCDGELDFSEPKH